MGCTLVAEKLVNPVDGNDGGFLGQSGEICADKGGRFAGRELEVKVAGEGEALGGHLESAHAGGEVGHGEAELAIEAAGPAERAVEGVGAPGGADDLDA